MKQYTNCTTYMSKNTDPTVETPQSIKHATVRTKGFTLGMVERIADAILPTRLAMPKYVTRPCACDSSMPLSMHLIVISVMGT